MTLTPFSEVQPLTTEWLWQGRIPLQQMTLIAGESGIGKSMLTADWASRVTRGALWPDGTSSDVSMGSVILVNSEDDPNRSTWYRLDAAGADKLRVYDGDDDGEFVVPGTLAALQEDIERIGDVRMVVIDPLSDVASIPLTSSTVRVRRYIVRPLEKLARVTGVAIPVIHHTVKSGSIAGNKGIVDAARMVLRVAKSPQDERVRLITVEKSNVASDEAPAMAYAIVGDSATGVHVQYVGVPDDVATAAHEPTTADRVLVALGSSPTPMETQAIARATGDAYGNVRVALTRLKAKQQVSQPERGLWELRKPEDLPPLEVKA